MSYLIDDDVAGGARADAGADRLRAQAGTGGRDGVSDGAGAVTAGKALAGSALRWRLGFAEDRDDVPIAERFRRACAEVEAARAARRERNHQKRKNRNLNRLAASSSERHIFRAMDDVSLVDLH